MKINEISSMWGSIEGVSVEHEWLDRAEQLSKTSKDSLKIAEENIAASMVRLKDVTSALELLRELQIQITSQPGAALLAQANIEAKNISSLLG